MCFSEGKNSEEEINYHCTVGHKIPKECRNITRKYALSRTEEAAKYLEQTKLQTSNGFTEEFTVMEDLMGLAIGKDIGGPCISGKRAMYLLFL